MKELMRWLDALQMRVSCRKFAMHVSSEDPIPGGFSMRIYFWIHWMVCPFCRRYWKEIREIGRIHKTLMARHPAVRIPQFKQQLKDALLRRYS